MSTLRCIFAFWRAFLKRNVQDSPHSRRTLRRSPAGRASIRKRDPVIQVAFLQVVHSRFDVVDRGAAYSGSLNCSSKSLTSF
jgi:hypothetical protein